MRHKTLVNWLIAISVGFVLSNGVMMGLFSGNPFFVGVGVIFSAAAVLVIICLAEGTFRGNPRHLSELDTRGEVSYSVLPLMRRYPGCEFLNIAEDRSNNGFLCAIPTGHIRDGADAIPRDGTPFKLVEGNGYDDIVVIKVPTQEAPAAPVPVQRRPTPVE